MPQPVSHYRVAYADTDQMGVVYYGNYLQIFERARTEWLRQRGMSYRELEAMDVALPVTEAHVAYHAPARYDDILDLYADFKELKGPRITLNCYVKRDGKLLVDGYTTLAFVNRKTGRPMRPPQELLRLLRPQDSQGDEP